MSTHPQYDAVGGSNPNYYAETSSMDNRPPPAGSPPVELAGDEPPRPPPVLAATKPDKQQQQYFPPPPPGPPPSSTGQQQQQYFPPPPPGPPPNQQQTYHPLQSHPSHYTAASNDLPAYTPQAAPGLSVTGPTEAASDEKPPALPPRPASGQGGQQIPYFPPPPGSSSSSRPGSSQGGQQQVPSFAPPPLYGGQHSQQQPTTAEGTGSGAAAAAAPAKKGFGERLYQWSIKAGVPINKVTNKLGSEAFWPTSMDKECDKAARILKSFCKDGFYTSQPPHPPPSPGHPTSPGPSKEQKSLVKIPAEAIRQAKGLAIFTTFRTGLHLSGAGGSGLVVARLPNGGWSPPAGFLVHTLGAGFMVGLDIYDCVCVLRTEGAVRAFTRPRLSLGGEVAVVAGPVGAGAALEGAVGGGDKPVWSYMKSRGFYAGVQADGTIIVERPDANAAFYGEKKISVDRILRGEVQSSSSTAGGGGAGDAKDKGGVVMWRTGARQLIEVLKAAEGKKADENVVGEVGSGPTPGDLAGTDGVHHPESDKKTADMLGVVRYG